MIWLGVFKDVTGIGLKMQIGLFLSAALDVTRLSMGSSVAKLLKTYFSGVVYLRPYGVYFYVRACSDDLYSVLPRREDDVNELILSSLKKGDVFVDVGANVGYYTIIISKIIGNNGQVISFEPTPMTAKVLLFNIKLNGLNNVKVIQKAAWIDKGSKPFVVPEGFFGWASIQKNTNKIDKFEVETLPLDDLFEIHKIDLLKIDAEGSEYAILQGGLNALEKTSSIVLELSDEKSEIIKLLKEKGFKIKRLNFCSYIHATKN